MREAQIKISPDGSEVEMEGKTFQGKECIDFFHQFHKVLGELEEEKKLSSYFVGPKQRVKNG